MSAPANRETRLSREEIAAAALAMVDRDGVDEFSMRRLARDLGVTTMAVYHHFENKAEILQAAADRVWIEAVLAMAPHEDPVEDLVQSMLVIRRTFMRHSDVANFAIASPSVEAAVHVTAVSVVERFEAAGFRGDAVGRAYLALATYTLGGTLLHSQRTILARTIRRSVSDLATIAPADLDGQRPATDAYASVRAAMDSDPDLVHFERGLRDILAGLLATLT